MFEAVNKQSVSDVVFDQLRDRIVNQELKAGEELPSERLLCDLLKVSRNGLREAIKRLQQAGLVEVRHGGATTVLDYKAVAGPELLPSLLVDAEGRILVTVARSILRMRQVLSPEIAADAAGHGGAAVAEQLDDLLKQMVSTDNPAQLQHLALRYWEILVVGSENIAYRLAFNSLRKTYHHIWGLLTQMLAGEFSDYDSFSKIAAAIRAGDRQAAFDCAKAYIDHNTAVIENFLDAYEEGSRASGVRP